MTVTTTYGFAATASYDFLSEDAENDLSELRITSLSGGGVAFAGDRGGDMSIGVAAPGATLAHTTFNSSGGDPAIDQLAGGGLAVVSVFNGDLKWDLLTNEAHFVSEGDFGTNNVRSADVAALTGGGFVIATQYGFSGLDNDIGLSIRDAAGVQTGGFTIDATSADDESPSLAALSNGGFAVAWDRFTPTGSHAYVAVYNAAGEARVAPVAFDTIGTDNFDVKAVGLAKNGFAIAYVDNGWNGSDNITVAIFKANGKLVHEVDVSTGGAAGGAGHIGAEPSLCVLQDGTLAVVWTETVTPTDHDIYMQLVNPKTGALMLPSVEAVASGGDNQHGASVAALGQGEVLVSYIDDTLGSRGEDASLRLTHEGGDENNTIIGGGVADVMDGNGGADVLKGGDGNDILDGGAGKDLLNGGAGFDQLTGGSGHDIFQFTSIISDGDVITDLQHGDHINLKGIDADVTKAGDQAFTIVAAFTHHAGEMTIAYNGSLGETLLSMDLDGDGVSDGRVVLAGNHADFTGFTL